MIVHNRKETERRVTGLGGGGCRGCLREGGGRQLQSGLREREGGRCRGG